MISEIKKVFKKVLSLINPNKKHGVRIKKQINGTDNEVLFNEVTTNLINCTFSISGNNNSIAIDEFCTLKNVIFYINGSNNVVTIGKKVKFNRGGEIWVEDNNCLVKIDEASTFENVHLACTEPYSKIEIGKDCMFAYDIDVRTGDSHSIIDAQTLKRINFAKNIKIGDHVWVASHVSILKGVQIANDSVIATRSVVTKSFDSKNLLIAGQPAKQIKNNINWDRRRIYERD